MMIDGVRTFKPLFGGRVKEIGTGAMEALLTKGSPQADVSHLIGYAANGSMFHCVLNNSSTTNGTCEEDVIGCVFSPSHYMKPIKYGTIRKTGAVTTLQLQAAHVQYKLVLKSNENPVKFEGRTTSTVQILAGTAVIAGTEFQTNLFEVSSLHKNNDEENNGIDN